MLNKPKYILFILAIAFSALTLANVILFYLHIEDPAIFFTTTLATCSFSVLSLVYLFFHFKINYISKKVIENEEGEIDIKKLKTEIEKLQKEKKLELRKKDLETKIRSNTENFENFITRHIVKEMDACQSAYFKVEMIEDKKVLKLSNSYAYHLPEDKEVIFDFGEGLAGQAASEGKIMNISKVPEGYISVVSGLGKASPSNMLIVPIWGNGQVKGVLEMASFKAFNEDDEKLLEYIREIA